MSLQFLAMASHLCSPRPTGQTQNHSRRDSRSLQPCTGISGFFLKPAQSLYQFSGLKSKLVGYACASADSPVLRGSSRGSFGAARNDVRCADEGGQNRDWGKHLRNERSEIAFATASNSGGWFSSHGHQRACQRTSIHFFTVEQHVVLALHPRTLMVFLCR